MLRRWKQQLEPTEQYGDRPTGRKAGFPAAFPFVFIREPLKGDGYDGMTKAMVAELDNEYGHDNPAESLFCLRNAWHAATGFAGESIET